MKNPSEEITRLGELRDDEQMFETALSSTKKLTEEQRARFATYVSVRKVKTLSRFAKTGLSLSALALTSLGFAFWCSSATK